MNEGLNHDMQAMRGDWQAVGGFLSAAMREVAIEFGGEEFAAEVSDLAASDGLLPNPGALRRLEDAYPGSAGMVIARMCEIQEEAHRQELAATQ